MKPTDKTTERPWSVIAPLYDDEKDVYIGIKEKRMGRSDYHVCMMLGHGAEYDNDPEQQANAALICRAVNNHEALVKALQEVVKVWEGPRERAAVGFAQAIIQARAALKLAEEVEQ